MASIGNGSLRLTTQQDSRGRFGFITEWRDDHSHTWQSASKALSYPLDGVAADAVKVDENTLLLSGVFAGANWTTAISLLADGFLLETRINVASALRFSPAMVLWLDQLDELNSRQAHTWRQTILRAPTINQQGLVGNDLPAGYIYDHDLQLEAVVYAFPDTFAWSDRRFHEYSLRELTVYRPIARYGFGLLPNPLTPPVQLGPGEHRFAWWFTKRRRDTVPSPWEAQRILIDAVTPLLDVQPSPPAIDWQDRAASTLRDLDDDSCWIEVEGQRSLRAYVRGSSAVGRDAARGFELMTVLDILWPLLLWKQVCPAAPQADALIARLREPLPTFYRPQYHFITNGYPPRGSNNDTFMDTWYFLENALIKWPWVAYLLGDDALMGMFLDALDGAQTLAHNTNYLFPLFADASDWQPRGSLLNVSVGGLYAAGQVIAHQMTHDNSHLDEAARALATMHQLPPHQLTHEPQQLTFAAAAARYLARCGDERDWSTIAADFAHLLLRMGYWGKDPKADFYDPRGMFQACASLSYPAYKENVESLLAWPELIKSGIGPVKLFAAFANLQRHHNRAFFDPYLPESVRRGPCPHIPYEDLATTEFRSTAQLGKELYGTGEVFWSALLFGALGHVDNPNVLCLSLDIPCLELKPLAPPDQRAYLLYNPTPEAQSATFASATERLAVTLSPDSLSSLRFTPGQPPDVDAI